MSAAVLRMIDPAAYALNVHAVPFGVTCTLLLTMVLLVLAKRRGPIHVSFAVLAGSAFIWQSGHVLLDLTTDPVVALGWSRYKYVGVTTLGANFYLFVLAYVGRLQAERRSLIAFYVLSALFLVLAWLPVDHPAALIIGVRRFHWGYYAQLSPSIGVAYLGMFVLQSAAAFYHVVAARVACRSAAERTRCGLLLASFGGAYLAGIDFLPCFGVSTYPVGYLFVTLFLALFAYSIVRHNLLDVAAAIHQTALWILTSFVIVVPLAAGLLWADPWLRQLSTFELMAVHLLLFSLMFLYVQHVQPQIDHFFQRRRYDVLRTVEKFNEEIRDLHGLEPLARRFVRTVERILRPEHAALFLFLDDSVNLPLPIVEGASAACLASVQPAAYPAFFDWLCRWNEVLDRERLSDVVGLGGIEDNVRAYFDRFQTQLVVPLVQGGVLIGALHVDKKRDGRPYTVWDLRLLGRLRCAAAVALANSLLFEQVQQLNRRLTEANADLESSNRILQARNEELTRARNQLIHSSKLVAVGEMSAKIAHELGNPIGIISGSVQFCLDSLPLSGEVRQHLEVVGRHAQNAGQILRGLLRLARPEELRLEAMTPCEAVAQVTAMLNGRSVKRGARFELEVPAGLPRIHAVRSHFEQILLNVFLNALESVPDDGWIRVEAGYDAGERSVTFDITDNGPGVPVQDLERIFEPFCTTRPGGTGLGLSICRDLLAAYGGTISAKDAPRGTRFVIRFPAGAAEVAKSWQPPPATPGLQ
jgi:signal transduction histidine kinase